MNKYKLEVNRFFDAAHDLPDSENLVTKQCANLHGHTYLAKVFIESERLEDGMVVDFKKVKQVIDKLDHQYIGYKENLFGFSETFPPTAENIAQWISAMIKDKLGFIAEVWICEGYKGQETLSWAKYTPEIE